MSSSVDRRMMPYKITVIDWMIAMRLCKSIFSVLLFCFMATSAWAGKSSCILQSSYTNSTVERLMSAVPSAQLESIADRLARLSTCELRVNVYPIARIWQMYHQNQLTVILGATQSPQRNATGVFFEFIQTPTVWLSLDTAPQARNLKEIQQLPNLLLGHVRGTEYSVLTGQFIQKMRLTQQVDESVDDIILIKKIRAGRISGAFYNQLVYQELLKQHEAQGLRATPIKELGPVLAGIYVNPHTMRSNDFLRLSQALKQLQSERYLAQLFAKRNQ